MRGKDEPAEIDWPPELGRVAEWQGNVPPDLSRGSLIALPGSGFGSERYMWALAMHMKEVAMTAMRPTEGRVLRLNMFAECVVGMTGCELLSVVSADRELDPASYVRTTAR